MLTEITGNKERRGCPKCNTIYRMNYVFPAPQKTMCAELHAWRFQRCVICWWTGDIETGQYILFERRNGVLIADGVGYPRGLPEYLVAMGICKDLDDIILERVR